MSFFCRHEPLIAQLRADLAATEHQAEAWQRLYEMESRRFDDLFTRYHALAHPVPTVTTVAPIAPVEPVDDEEGPPDVVLNAMKAISPTKDKTYEANWRYWEQHKDRARDYPDDFAAEILAGAT